MNDQVEEILEYHLILWFGQDRDVISGTLQEISGFLDELQMGYIRGDKCIRLRLSEGEERLINLVALQRAALTTLESLPF